MYKTSQLAKLVNLHPNTLRFYEEIGYLPPVSRQPNGYRFFTDLHLNQLKLIKTALRSGLTQNGLRQQAIAIIKLCAQCNYEAAITKANQYEQAIEQEMTKAVESSHIVHQLLKKTTKEESELRLTRQEAAHLLNIKIDAIRNWELNGLLTVSRASNGYRIYTEKEIKLLKIIRTLREANYSLQSILRLVNQLENRDLNIQKTLNTPAPDEDIIYVTDHLISTLTEAKKDAKKLVQQIKTLQYTTRL